MTPVTLGNRSLTDTIPPHLASCVVNQDYSLYTPIDHAVWRFILKLARDFFAEHAHQKYLDGLKETGISTERIPRIEEMDAKLKRFGWRAVAVSGFIPPASFMEFLSLGILPIACDMRSHEHLAYTPAPDIVHEAAGHAPIIADAEYREYLRSYGEVSRHAILSSQDMDVYEAIRNLSIVKEDPASSAADIARAQSQLDAANAAVTYVSEATELSRMGWWTFEYGLVGPLDAPKIYGAGLLSSVGEGLHCLKPPVKHLPFSIACIEQTYDITRPQPQLYVAPDFATLKRGLEELADRMAFRRGGMQGLQRALQARTVTTVELDSGLQISGVLGTVRNDEAGHAAFLKFNSPVQLSVEEREIPGHGATTHREGYSTPIGKLAGVFAGRLASELSERELAGITELHYASGIRVRGILGKVIRRAGVNLILPWTDCTVMWGDEVLYKPEWGTFDLACGGSEIASVFGGAADRLAYFEQAPLPQQPPGKPKTNLTASNRVLNTLFARVRAVREQQTRGAAQAQELAAVARERAALQAHVASGSEQQSGQYNDWLLAYELVELGREFSPPPTWAASARAYLDAAGRADSGRGELIERALKLL